jgi:hypothetical protein
VTHDVVRLVYADLPTPDVLVTQDCRWTVIADPRMASQYIDNVMAMVRAGAALHRLDEEPVTSMAEAGRYVSLGDVTIPVLRTIRMIHPATT